METLGGRQWDGRIGEDERFGAPLVLKTANGSAFIAQLLVVFLATQRVTNRAAKLKSASYDGDNLWGFQGPSIQGYVRIIEGNLV